MAAEASYLVTDTGEILEGGSSRKVKFENLQEWLLRRYLEAMEGHDEARKQMLESLAEASSYYELLDEKHRYWAGRKP